MSKLFSNPWKDSSKLSSKIKYRVRGNYFINCFLKNTAKAARLLWKLDVRKGILCKQQKKWALRLQGVELDERFKKKNIIIKDVYDMKGKYDVVFSNHVIEGMEHEKFVKKMTELSNNIVITVGTYLNRNFWNTPDFKFPVTKVRLRWLFRRYGFRNLLSIHIPFWKAVLVVSKKVTDKDNDLEARRIRQGFW